MKTILIYTQNKEKESALKGLAESQDLAMILLSRGQLDRPLYRLLELPALPLMQAEISPAPLLYNPPELMILHGFSSEELDGFLKTYRERGIEPIALKAVTTLHNLAWTPYYLAEHLREEAERISQKR